MVFTFYLQDLHRNPTSHLRRLFLVAGIIGGWEKHQLSLMASQPTGTGPMGMCTPGDAGSPDIKYGAPAISRKTEQSHHLHFLSRTGKGLRKCYLDSRSRKLSSSSSLWLDCPIASCYRFFVFFCFFSFGKGGLAAIIIEGGGWYRAERAERELVTVGKWGQDVPWVSWQG